MLLEGKIVLVTGASRGIGAATARLLARHGARVGVNYRESEGAAREVVAEIRASGGVAVALRADVRERAEVDAMVRAVEAELGPLDALVINASIAFPTVPFVDYPWEAFRAKLVGELESAFNCCKAVVPGMIARKRGSIVAVSSGLSRRPGPGFCAHTTAKSGLDGFAKSLALELGPHGIRVNVVAPGLTNTDAVRHLPEQARQASARAAPLQRIAEPSDIAGAVLMLVSDAAGFVTGAYLPVSGGSLML
jgi:3-oxoacyl-[acyl-carrier protein] reductase